jgi:hypothetical protein
VTSVLDTIEQQDFSGGSQLDFAPHLIDPRAFYKATNFLCDDDGSLYERGGTENKSNAAFGTAGRFLWSGHLKPGLRTVFASPNDFGVLAADDATPVNLGGPGLSAPASAAELRGYLFLPGGWIYGGSRKTSSYAAGTATVANGSAQVTGAGTAWLANVDAGMLFRRSGERAYIVESVDSDTQITLEEEYAGSSASGSAYTLDPITQATAPYTAADFYAVCADRLVWANGDRIEFSGLDDPHTHAEDDYHELPEGGEEVAFATVGQTLLAFATSGVWTIDGLGVSIVDSLGNAQHRVQQYSGDLIALGSAGIASWQGRLIVPCLDGIWLLDGTSTPVEISNPVEALWRRYVSLGYRTGGATVYNSHYFLPVLDASGSWVDTMVCRLDRPIRSRDQITWPWTFLSGAGGEIAAYARHYHGAGTSPHLIGATEASTARIVTCSSYFSPDANHKLDADGSTPEPTLVTRDFPIEMGTVRKAELRYELLDAGSDNPTLQMDYSTGARLSGATQWGSFNWGAGDWSAVDDTDWTAIPGVAPERDGQHPYTFHINKRFRHMRLRIKSSAPAARLTIRGLRLFVRPSRKVR